MKNYLEITRFKANRLSKEMSKDSRCNQKFTSAVESIRDDLSYILTL